MGCGTVAPDRSALMRLSGQRNVAGLRRLRRRAIMRLDLPRDLAAAFDLDLAIADRARDLAAGAHQQALLDDELAFEAAMYIGIVCRDGAPEDAGLRDDDLLAAVQFCVDRPFRNQPIACGDRARHRHSRSDDQRPRLDLVILRPRIWLRPRL